MTLQLLQTCQRAQGESRLMLTKPAELSSGLGTHMMEGQTQFLKAVSDFYTQTSK